MRPGDLLKTIVPPTWTPKAKVWHACLIISCSRWLEEITMERDGIPVLLDKGWTATVLIDDSIQQLKFEHFDAEKTWSIVSS